jgi:hypothetical protein
MSNNDPIKPTSYNHSRPSSSSSSSSSSVRRNITNSLSNAIAGSLMVPPDASASWPESASALSLLSHLVYHNTHRHHMSLDADRNDRSDSPLSPMHTFAVDAHDSTRRITDSDGEATWSRHEQQRLNLVRILNEALAILDDVDAIFDQEVDQ